MSLQNYALATTAWLSRTVQNFIAITSLLLGREINQISVEFELLDKAFVKKTHVILLLFTMFCLTTRICNDVYEGFRVDPHTPLHTYHKLSSGQV